MSLFNVVFLLPGYLPAESGSQPEALPAQRGMSIQPIPAQVGVDNPAISLQWHPENMQIPWQFHLCQHLGIKGVVAETLPVARLSAGNQDPSAGVVCADPIHLRADRDTATLLPPEMLMLSDQESDELINSLNEFVASDGWQFFRNPAGSWFMQGMEGSALSSYPPSFLAHRNASSYLPDGEGSEQWRRLMAELQMLLHTHPVNQSREQRGQITVNSLWFWGGGQLPQPTDTAEALKTNAMTVFSDHPFTIALCKYFKVPLLALREFDPLSVTQAIVVDTRIADAAFAGDDAAMRASRHRIDQDWLLPLSERLRASRDGKFRLINEEGDWAEADGLTSMPTEAAAGLWMSVVRHYGRMRQGWRWLLKPFSR